MSTRLTREDLLSLEKYDLQRSEFRNRIAKEKKPRRIAIGPSIMMHFENRLIMQYQVQEMLRAEKIFDSAGIEEELSVYNDLIPDGSNWKATMMIEFPDPEIRARELAKLIGIERMTWVRIGDADKVYAIANEDLVERETEEKTSSVHFMRFELDEEMIKNAKAGEKITIGIDHDAYRYETLLNPESTQSLVADLD